MTIAGLVASALRLVGLGTNTEYETGGWRDVRDDELLSPMVRPGDSDSIDLKSQASESV